MVLKAVPTSPMPAPGTRQYGPPLKAPRRAIAVLRGFRRVWFRCGYAKMAAVTLKEVAQKSKDM